MSIENLLTDLIAAIKENTQALSGSKTAAATVETKAPAKTETKTTAKTETKAPAKTETKVKAPAKNKVVSVEDAAATATSFLAVDDEKERNKRRTFVVELVTALGYDKVRNITEADDRADFVRVVEQATDTIEDGVVTDYPVIEKNEPAAEDEV